MSSAPPSPQDPADRSSGNPVRTIRIATRESDLAMWQANYVAEALRQSSPDADVTLIPLSTIGDRDKGTPLHQLGAPGVFTREIQRAVLNQDADVAVHSLKDLPTRSAAGLVLAGIPARAPRFDALVLPRGASGTIASLPSGARVGTSSLRRQAQLLRARPDLVLEPVRGNVETRIRKVDDGTYHAVILAEAGLRRLGLADRISEILAPPVLYPAVGQAALGIECRDDDHDLVKRLERISCGDTRAEALAERACMETLQAGCHAPVGVLAQVAEDLLTLEGVVLSADGTQRFTATASARLDEARALGIRVAELLLEQGAGAVLKAADGSAE